jgi:N-acetylglucosamine-6-phosphate deacetylase
MTAIAAHRIFDGTMFRGAGTIRFNDGIIERVEAEIAGDAEVFHDGEILAPGFVDLQVNGGGGVMFNDQPDPSGLRVIAAAHARTGTTSLLPTLISGSRAAIDGAIAAVRGAGDVPGIVGLHVEGPFIAPSRRGIHPLDAIIPMTEADVARLTSTALATLLVTIAPEFVSSAFVAALCRHGVIVFAGHSDADYAATRAGLAAGVSGFTHLFNAMSPFGSREPGMVGSALGSRDAFAGIIVDGHHVHPASVAAAYAAMGPARLLLVSDAMATAGAATTSFSLYGKPITLRDGRLTDAAGTLAGAHLTMAEAVRNAVEMVGIRPADALRMATVTPADAIGRRDLGRIVPGARADLVAMTGSLAVKAVWQGGVRIR